MGVEEIEAEIEAMRARIERYTKDGADANALEPMNIALQRAERKLAKEEAKLPVHPAYVSSLPSPDLRSDTVRMNADYRLVFGPIAQTVAAMSCISLGMSPLPIAVTVTITRPAILNIVLKDLDVY